MKRICLSLSLAGLIATGCMQTSKRPAAPQSTSTAKTDVVVAPPAAPAPKLLPADEVNAANAKTQAQILDEMLKKENN